MTTMILISSSPPPMFARDPTPFDYSPSRSPPSTNAHGISCSPKRFKTSNVSRDSFSVGFRSASSMLAVRSTAENVPIQSPGKGRFKTVKSILPVRKTPPFVARNDSIGLKITSVSGDEQNSALGQQCTTAMVSDIAANDRTRTPQKKPVRRRLDWTPVEDDEDAEATSACEEDETTRLMNDFGFRPTSTEAASTTTHGNGVSTARKTRIDVIQAPCSGPIVIKASKGASRAKPKPAKPKKAKAVTKKAKTITELVTSHYRGRNKIESPMAEFLVASQAKTLEAPLLDIDGLEVATKGLKRKAGALKALTRKRQLLSPASAMKAFDRQETVFGSASQLARDEPRIEADLSSDPISPLRTQVTSRGSISPQVARGSTRFMKSRNLWGAADRDDDNALLHVDSVDLFDTPLARNAFVGKDALIAPQIAARMNANESGGASAVPGMEHTLAQRGPGNMDVDNTSSPSSRHRQSLSSRAKISVRQLHTSARASQKPTPAEDSRACAEPDTSGVADTTRAQAPRPNYKGMQTGELQTLIKNYGFKAIKSRDKMVDLLNKCWDEKEARRATRGLTQAATQTPPTPVKARHSDLISNVHDLSNRPQPKAKKVAKKPRAARTKPATEETAKEPKKRKKAAADTSPTEKPKRGRPKKPKTALLEEKVVDIDDVDDDFTTLTTLRESATTLKESTKTNDTQEVHVPGSKTETHTEAGAELSPDIFQQIHAAILHQSEQAAEVEGWDHVRLPTWHEKMLMYDPIIIEDLARWLNAEGLNGVQEDREVTTIEVRDWCESRGVCCIFNGGWRGNASRGGD